MHIFDLAMPMYAIADQLPPEGETVLLRGTSGYRRAGELDVCLGYYEPAYPLAPWRNVANDSVGEVGFKPTHWAFVTFPKA